MSIAESQSGPISSAIRLAVDNAIAAGVTRYSIAQDAKIDYASFVRWLDKGRDIRSTTIDKLAVALGVTANVPKLKPTKKSAKK